MINKSKAIPIRLSIKAYEAYVLLSDKHCNRSDIICKHGEIGLIKMAEKYKRPKLVMRKDLLPF